MVLTFSPIVNIFRFSQPQNAPSLIVFPEAITLVKPMQPINASLPISVTEFGISTLTKLLQPEYLLLVDYQHPTL